MTKIFMILLILLTFVTVGFSQVTSTAVTSANIITQIEISKSVDMNFGNIAVSPTISGSVVLTTTSTRTKTGGVTLPAVTGDVTSAKFTVIGLDGSTYSLTLPLSVVLTGPSSTMTVNNFKTLTSSGSVLSTSTLVGGTDDIYVGGTLNVNAGQLSGLYTNASDLFVTVNYN